MRSRRARKVSGGEFLSNEERYIKKCIRAKRYGCLGRHLRDGSCNDFHLIHKYKYWELVLHPAEVGVFVVGYSLLDVGEEAECQTLEVLETEKRVNEVLVVFPNELREQIELWAPNKQPISDMIGIMLDYLIGTEKLIIGYEEEGDTARVASTRPTHTHTHTHTHSMSDSDDDLWGDAKTEVAEEKGQLTVSAEDDTAARARRLLEVERG